MASRYLITGVQLGMLIALNEMDERQRLVAKIENQYVGYSLDDIHIDVKTINDILGNNIIVKVGILKYALTNTQYVEIKKFKADGLRISAVKYLRDQTGLSLKECIELVKAI